MTEHFFLLICVVEQSLPVHRILKSPHEAAVSLVVLTHLAGEVDRLGLGAIMLMSPEEFKEGVHRLPMRDKGRGRKLGICLISSAHLFASSRTHKPINVVKIVYLRLEEFQAGDEETSQPFRGSLHGMEEHVFESFNLD